MALPIVPAFENARKPGNAETTYLNDASVPQIVDVGCHPPAVEEFPEVVGCLVVSTHEDGEHGRNYLA